MSRTACHISIVLAMLMTVGIARAQEDPEYRAEIGAGIGMEAYQGDFNSSLTSNMQPVFSLMGKYRFNPRMALNLRISYAKLEGSSDKLTTWYPDMQEAVYRFSTPTTDASLTYEYNFWPYGTGREYRGAQRLTPYIAIGLGFTFAQGDVKHVTTANLPLGLGVKYKVADRVNLCLEWMAHFTMTDMIDGVEDPYGIKSSGIFKNTDGYTALSLSVSYDIWAKCKTCHNDRD